MSVAIKTDGSEPYWRLRNIMGRMTYKPGWKIELRMSGQEYPGGPDTPQLWITFRAPDATGKQQGEIIVNKVSALPPYIDDEREFLRFVEMEVLEVERHEVHEWLKLDGKCITEPHR